MPELPIYPDRVREAPGYALARRLALQREVPQLRRDEAHHRQRVDCAFETLRLTGAGVDRSLVERIAQAPRDRKGSGAGEDGLVSGQLEALEAIELAARDARISIELVRDVHRRANPPSEGEFRSEDLKPQFQNARPSLAQFIEVRLQDLLDWLSSESGRSMFPAERMALWFPRFLEISPFARANFRTAHLFLTHFACAEGFPPVTLRLEEAEDVRSEVENALRFDTYPLVRRFSGTLERSLAVLENLDGSS